MRTAEPKHNLKARILVVEDNQLLRQALVQVIEEQPDLICCAEAEGAEAAQRAVREHQPDLVLLDVRLKDSDGLELLQSLRAEFAVLRILVVSMHDEARFIQAAMSAGANGYITKQEAIQHLIPAIRLVLKGEPYVSQKGHGASGGNGGSDTAS